MLQLENFLNNYNFFIWDFDGVIKESLEVKGSAYIDLFKNKITNLEKQKILNHHNQNIGESRYTKIPKYMEFCSVIINENAINKYLNKYSEIVAHKVVNSPWVEDVRDFLEKNAKLKNFFLVSSTPQLELELIIKELKFDQIFKEIYGEPHKKQVTFRKILREHNEKNNNFIALGDSTVDYNAAKSNKVDFLLRQTNYNKIFHKSELKAPEGWSYFNFSY